MPSLEPVVVGPMDHLLRNDVKTESIVSETAFLKGFQDSSGSSTWSSVDENAVCIVGMGPCPISRF